MTSKPAAAVRYRYALLAAAADDVGHPIQPGTTVVPSPDRTGSTAAVAYPLGDVTVIFCSPDLRSRLDSLNNPHPLSIEEYGDQARRLGGEFLGAGRNRVMTGVPPELHDPSYQLVDLDRHRPSDRDLLESLIAVSSEDDVEEAELDMDELEPTMVALVDSNGSIASYASGRPWSVDAEFDDIAVLTHPDHRGRRLGSIAVAYYVRQQQQAGRYLFYNCNDENVGSNRVADAVGFKIMYAVIAYDFD